MVALKFPEAQTQLFIKRLNFLYIQEDFFNDKQEYFKIPINFIRF